MILREKEAAVAGADSRRKAKTGSFEIVICPDTSPAGRLDYLAIPANSVRKHVLFRAGNLSRP